MEVKRRNLLHGLCYFKHLAASECQVSSEQVLEVFQDFCRTQRTNDEFYCTIGDRLHGLNSSSNGLTFFPEYGCVLVVFSGLDAFELKTSRLHLLALDAWDFHQHDNAEFNSQNQSHADIFAGTAITRQLAVVIQCVFSTLRKIKKPKKTPATILCVVKDVLTGINQLEIEDVPEIKPLSQPRGAFTEVTEKRNTSCGLALAVVEILVRESREKCQCGTLTFEEIKTSFILWLLEAEIEGKFESSPFEINLIMTSIDVISSQLIDMIDKGYVKKEDIDYEHRLEEVKRKLHTLVDRRSQYQCNRFNLNFNGNADLNFGLDKCTHPVLRKPPAQIIAQANFDLATSRRIAKDNLNVQTLLSAETCIDVSSLSCARVLSWITTKYSVADLSTSYIVHHSMNAWFFAMAGKLLQVHEEPILTEFELGNLEQLVECYRISLSKFIPNCKGQMLTQLESRGKLVVWIAYCLAHHAVSNVCPLLNNYGVSLTPGDLRHLSLSDKASTDALCIVHTYLCAKDLQGPPIFSLRSDDDSLKFAFQFSRSSAGITAIWKDEQREAADRIQRHWQQAEDKRTQISSFEKKISLLEREIAEFESDRTRALSESTRHYYNKEITSCTRKIYNLRRQIEETAPLDDLIQPLPNAEFLSLQVLFFLHMPQDLKTLSHFSFMGQQVIISPFLSTLQLYSHKFEWLSHYDSHNSKLRKGQKDAVSIGSPLQGPKGKKSDVRMLTNSSQGIYYPNDIRIDLGWCGSSSLDRIHGVKLFNPFVPFLDTQMVPAYTSILPKKYYSPWMQAALHQYDSSSLDRSNVAIAKQNLRPTWLTKHQYLTFWSLRGFSNLQFRKLCCMLAERSLPLQNEAVQVLIKQALYHVGNIALRTCTTGACSHMVWKRDIVANKSLVEKMCCNIHELLDELEERPRDHNNLLAYIDILSYICHWDTSTTRDYHRLLQKCSNIATTWAQDVEPRIRIMNIVDDSEIISSLRALQTVFYMYAIIAREGTYCIDAVDVKDLVQFQVLANYGTLFKHSCSDVSLFSALHSRCQGVMSMRVDAIMKVVLADPNGILTSAVQNLLQRAPDDLVWHSLSTQANTNACFEAVSSAPEEHLYSINLLTGTVLFDGLPPSSLPKTILTHPLYRRSFGDRDFEIAKAESGILQSIRPLNGYFYDFHEYEGELLVLEKACRSLKIPDEYSQLQLMDSTSPSIGSWGQDLPIRVRENYSHWFCRTCDVVVVRPTNFFTRNVSYIINLVKKFSECCRIPLQLTLEPWFHIYLDLKEDNFEKADMLMCWDKSNAPQILNILAKVESMEYLHVLRNLSNCSTKIEFPRYKWEFELKDGCSDFKANHYSEYKLAPQQQLGDTLHGFCQYILLEHVRGLENMKMVIPKGIVTVKGKNEQNECCDISGDNASGADRPSYIYDINHRFKDLRAGTIEARLQLAGIYTATSTGLPEYRTSRTGEEFALYLVRRCYVDRPLSPVEEVALVRLKAMVTLVPALYLLCDYVWNSSRQLTFLHAPDTNSNQYHFDEKFNDMATAYMQQRKNNYCNARTVLTAEEEKRILQRQTTSKVPTILSILPKHTVQIEASTFESDLRHVYSIEQEFRRILLDTRAVKRCTFPISREKSTETRMATEMLDELEDSFLRYLEQREFYLMIHKKSTLSLIFAEKLGIISNVMRVLEVGLHEDVRKATLQHGSYVSICNLLRCSNRMMTPTIVDMIEVVWNPSRFKDFIPFSQGTDVCIEGFKQKLVAWMEACVLQDKLRRLLNIIDRQGSNVDIEAVSACSNDEVSFDVEQLIVKELCCIRPDCRDESIEHSLWLPFEVDNGIQIRPEQRSVAQSLLDNPGAIVQLNMGEGKTRVIVPMMILAYSRMKQRSILRINFLSQLFGEAFYYLHDRLCAGIFNCKLFTLPFHRDVKLNAQRMIIMSSHIDYCLREGCALIVTPDSQCSLLLKYHELKLSGQDDLCDLLDRYMWKLPWKDLYDESDEILSHKYQLIYAVGRQEELPSLQIRAQAVFTILDILENDPVIGNLLTPDALIREPKCAIEAFPQNYRFVPGHELSQCLPRVIERIATVIVESPPYNLTWIARSASSEKFLLGFCSQLVPYMIDSSIEADQIISPEVFEEKSHRECLLALRGYLAFGLLEHCLSLRNRVNYGIARDACKQRKKVSVPFRGADAPSDRAEFAHPDVTIVLTTLSYYYDGLSPIELRQALVKLLSLGDNAQAVIYSRWFLRSFSSMEESPDAVSINKTIKLDVTNEVQFQLLLQSYSKNTEAIRFWLLYCLLPVEMMQYPQRIKASAWHLARHAGNEAGVGFSGTDDLHRLWPLQVHHHEQENPVLQSQRGSMLALITSKLRYVKLQSVQWKELIELAVVEGATALIDAGALLAGSSIVTVAKYILDKTDATVRGVTYFDGKQWVVLVRDGSMFPLIMSQIREKNTFVIFDDSHCRGADMKLFPTAVALLTLGPGMSKDKFMQAAGRMRGLKNLQHIIVTAQDDVHCAVSKLSINPSNIDIVNILQWIMSNTVKSAEAGLIEWASNALHFASGAVVEQERMKLGDMYKSNIETSTIAESINEKCSSLLSICTSDSLDAHATVENDIDVIATLQTRANTYGSTVQVSLSCVDEECERELELQQEVEQELEKQTKEEQPASEVDWDFRLVATGDWDAVANASKAMCISAAVSKCMSPEFQSIDWSKNISPQSGLYCTNNFLRTLEPNSALTIRTSVRSSSSSEEEEEEEVADGQLDEYLRPLDAFLVFSQGYVLLLSDREANAVLALSWTTYLYNVTLHHTIHVDEAIADKSVVVKLQLFNGCTMYSTQEKRAFLASLLSNRDARKAALSLPRLRGFGHLMSMSHLEDACEAEC